MTMTGRSVAVGLFDDRERARQAIEALKDAGFRGDDISLLMPDRGEARDLAEETGTKAGAGAATGAVTGGILGGIGGFLVGIGALAIPGVGPFIAAGALAATLGGAAVGAGVGAIAGALIGMGIPEEEAKYYEQEVRGGRTLVAVRADFRVDEADGLLHRYGAYDVQHRDRTPTGAGATSAAGVMDSDRSRLAEAGTAGATAGMPAASAGRWEDEAPHYRSRWQERFGTTGGRWEEYEPAYRYGWEMRSRPDYRDRRWDEIEPDLRCRCTGAGPAGARPRAGRRRSWHRAGAGVAWGSTPVPATPARPDAGWPTRPPGPPVRRGRGTRARRAPAGRRAPGCRRRSPSGRSSGAHRGGDRVGP